MYSRSWGIPSQMTSQWTNQGWGGDVEIMLQETLGKGERSGVTAQGSGMTRALWPLGVREPHNLHAAIQNAADAVALSALLSITPSRCSLGSPFLYWATYISPKKSFVDKRAPMRHETITVSRWIENMTRMFVFLFTIDIIGS